METLVIPPIRTTLQNNSVGSTTASPPIAPTAKEWYFYWQKGTERINLLSQMIGFGAHGDRPKNPPEGSLYVEQDRGEVLYQFQNGDWHYVAGTYWGTLEPDQRPANLGPNDAGFEFRTSVAPMRQFVWSGSYWVEIPVLPDPHTAPDGDVLTVNSGVAGSMYWAPVSGGGGANQTPWLQHIDGAGFNLNSAGHISCTLLSIGSIPIPYSPLYVSQLSPGGRTNVTFENPAPPAVGDRIRLRFGPSSGFTGTDLHPFIESLNEDTQQSSGLAFGTYYGGLAERVRISATGNVGIGVTDPTAQLQLSLDSAAKPGTNTWAIVSDIRTKQNIRPLEGGLEVINQLEPIVAEYNGKGGTPADSRVVSLDPAKLRGILPHAVSSVRGKLEPSDAEETDILGVNTHELLYHLVLAVQQLAKKP